MQPNHQSYDCTGCGDCCRGRFAILITEADKDRIDKQSWTDEELNLGGKPLFTRRGNEYQIAHRADGSCIFLQDDGLCRIHAKYGEPAKPLACRLYPFRFIPLGDQIRVDVRFDCPATASNNGRPISAHRGDLQKLVKDAVPDKAADQPIPPLHGRVQAGWGQLCRVTEAVERVLLDISLDLTRRVAACVNLVDLLRQVDFSKLEPHQLGDFLDEAAGHVQEGAVSDTLDRVAPHGNESAAFRQLLGVYARIDQIGDRAKPLERLTTSMRMLSGKGTVPAFRPDLPKVSFADIEGSRGIPSGDAALAVERYLHTHLSSMSFFGPSFYSRAYLDGLSALLLTYPLTCWFARAYAGPSKSTPDRDCFERALMIVDHQHGITPILDIPTERFRTNLLTDRSTLRSLVVWYGS
jgi:lysine-N-methylase